MNPSDLNLLFTSISILWLVDCEDGGVLVMLTDQLLPQR